MEVKVLGPGCQKCDKLYELTRRAVADAGVDATVTKVTELTEMAAAGVVVPPGLVIDGELISAGKVPRSARIAEWLREAAER
jgi:small redox-active disulfide protein 2